MLSGFFVIPVLYRTLYQTALTGAAGAVSGAWMTWMIPFTAGTSHCSSRRWFTILELWKHGGRKQTRSGGKHTFNQKGFCFTTKF